MTDVAAPAAPTTNNATAAPQSPTNADPNGASDGKATAQEKSAQRRYIEAAEDAYFKLKVDGTEEEISAAEAVKRLQRGGSANKRFEEAAKTRREAEAQLAAARAELQHMFSSPSAMFETLQKLGVPADQWAEMLYQMAQDERSMTPEQRELRDLKRQQAEWKRQQEESERGQREQQERAAQEREVQRFEQAFNTMIDRAIDGQNVPPKLRGHLIRSLAALAESHQASGQPLYMSDGVDFVRAQLEEMRGSFSEQARAAAEAEQRQRMAQVSQVAPTAPAATAPPQRGDDGRFRGTNPKTGVNSHLTPVDFTSRRAREALFRNR